MFNKVADAIVVDQLFEETEPVDSVHKHDDPIDSYGTLGENSAESHEDQPANAILADLNLTDAYNLTLPAFVQSELQSPANENTGKYSRNSIFLRDAKVD